MLISNEKIMYHEQIMMKLWMIVLFVCTIHFLNFYFSSITLVVLAHSRHRMPPIMKYFNTSFQFHCLFSSTRSYHSIVRHSHHLCIASYPIKWFRFYSRNQRRRCRHRHHRLLESMRQIALLNNFFNRVQKNFLKCKMT